MKKTILSFSLAISSLAFFQSCEKSMDPKYVNLDASIQSGSTYSLNLDSYAGKSSVASIKQQASSYTVSRIDKDAASGCGIYHFSTDSKTNEKQTVVLDLTSKNNSPCMHDDNKTVITINFSVQ